MTQDSITELIRQDMRKALGCTEPGIISLACAKAGELIKSRIYGQAASDTGAHGVPFGEQLTSISVSVNSGIYKNAYSCGIPGTPYIGNEYAAAIGAVGGDASKELTVLDGVSEADIELAKRLIDTDIVHVEVSDRSPVIYVNATVSTAEHTATVRITGAHTHYAYISVDGEELYSHEYSDNNSDSITADICSVSFAEMYEYIQNVPYGDIAFIDEALRVNEGLADEGLRWDRCTITKALISGLPDRVRDKLLPGDRVEATGIDGHSYARILTAAAIEARFLGAGAPAMSITGSGAHGIICTLPLAAEAYILGIDKERLIRAIALNYLVTMYIKECSGKLSAFCGCGIAGGLGAVYAMAYLRGDGRDVSERAFSNMTSSVTGMLCTGGNQACTLKAIAAVDAIYTALEAAEGGAVIPAYTGIVSDTPERTAHNIGSIADPGMIGTDGTILDIYTAESIHRKG